METNAQNDARNAQRFGPSPFMVFGGMLIHPLVWLSVVWCVFLYSRGFRGFLWQLNHAPWRRFLLNVWEYSSEHPGLWLVPAFVALIHLLIRFFTSHFALTDEYLFVQSGLFSFGSPGGPFRVFNDPIPFSTVLDANAQKGLLGLITGTGTLFIATSETQGRYIKLTWVPDLKGAQDSILARAGIRSARIMTSIRSS